MSFLLLISSFLCGLKEGGILRGKVDGSGVGMYYTLGLDCVIEWSFKEDA